MAHIVIYRGLDGETGYHQVDEVADAIRWVERLRNDQGVDGARIYRLEEVAFQFRPYFRVELGGDPPLDLRDDAGEPGPVEGAAEPVSHPDDVAPGATVTADVDPGWARRGLFGR